MKKAPLFWLCLSALSAVGESQVNAQAYCALRDPVSVIRRYNPESDGYRSLVGKVTAGVREQVSERLPFTIHLKELGAHTLYLASRAGVPETLIHVRSEKGRWGLVEIAWIFDIDLKVKGFVFQRCRDRNREVAESEAVQAQFAGKGFAELRSLLTEDGSRLRPGALDLASGAGDLAETLVRSALKTIAVTEIVWPEELRQMRLQVGATAPGR
jgi:hypothetical protein